MAKYKTTITEKDGTKSSGYIENGRSYYDNGKEINAGASVVDAQGKTWTKGGSTTSTSNTTSTTSTPSYNQTWESGGRTYVGGVDVGPAGTKVDTSNTAASYKQSYGDMGDKIQTNPYEEAYREAERRRQEMEEQIREQNRIAVEQGTNRLNAQKANINQAAEDNARQAYIMHMQAKKALPQQLVNQGATGGMTETANLGLQTTYQNNLNDINRNKINAIQEIDNAIVDLKNTGNLATVEQVLANNQAALDAYMTMLDKGVSYNQWANQYNAGRIDAANRQEQQRIDNEYRDQVYKNSLIQEGIDNAYRDKVYRQEQQEKQDEKKLNKAFSEDYQAIKSLSYADAISELKNNASAYMAEYGIDGYNLLWNMALEDAIKEGVVAGR
jgi:hypothetical protein